MRLPRRAPRGHQATKYIDFSIVFKRFLGSRLFGLPTLHDGPEGRQDRSNTATEAHKRAPGLPRSAQRQPKGLPRQPTRPPGRLQEGSQTGYCNGHLELSVPGAPGGSKRPPRGAQEAPKRPPRGHQEAPKRPQEPASRTPRSTPGNPQAAPRNRNAPHSVRKQYTFAYPPDSLSQRPRRPWMCPRRPQRSSNGGSQTKIRNGCFRSRAGEAPGSFRIPREAPKLVPEAPKRLQDNPRRHQDGSKRLPKRPTAAQDSHKCFQDSPISSGGLSEPCWGCLGTSRRPFRPFWSLGKLFRASLRPSCVGPGLSRGSLALF